MKIQLVSSSKPKQLTMADLQPGDIAEILDGGYAGKLVVTGVANQEKIALVIGDPTDTGFAFHMSCQNDARIPVRLLTSGECIRIVE